MTLCFVTSRYTAGRVNGVPFNQSTHDSAPFIYGEAIRRGG